MQLHAIELKHHGAFDAIPSRDLQANALLQPLSRPAGLRFAVSPLAQRRIESSMGCMRQTVSLRAQQMACPFGAIWSGSANDRTTLHSGDEERFCATRRRTLIRQRIPHTAW